MTQQPRLDECRTCRKAAVIKQYIDFEKIGRNNNTGKDIYLLHDHGTKDIHVHKKACTYGCNTIIVWDTENNKYRDFEGGEFHEVPCQGVERYIPIAEKQIGIIDTLRRSQMMAERANAQAQAISMDVVKAVEPLPNPNPQAPNPIAEQLAKSTPTPTDMSKTINFMWTMIKEIDRKVDAIAEMRKDDSNWAEVVDKRFNSIDEVLAEMITKIEPNQFVKGSDLLNETVTQADRTIPKEQPTPEELEDIFQEDDSH